MQNMLNFHGHGFRRGNHSPQAERQGALKKRLWQALTNPCLDDVVVGLIVIALFAATYYLCHQLPTPHPWTNPYGWLKTQ